MALSLGPALLASICGLVLPGQDPGEPQDPVRLLVGFTAEADGSRWDLLESLRGALARDDQDVSAQLLLALEAGTRNQPAAFVQWLQQSGGRVVQRFWIVNGSVVELPREAADALRAHAEVRSVEPDLLLGANINQLPVSPSVGCGEEFIDVWKYGRRPICR